MEKMVAALFERLLPNPDEHLSDERMADLFCRELPLRERWMARRHLRKCEHCRYRQEQLEGPRAERMLQMYRDIINSEDADLPEKPRADFALWLELQLQQAAPNKQRAPQFTSRSLTRFSFPTPAVSIGAGFGIVAAMLFFFSGARRDVQEIGANTLLTHAAKWETPSVTASPGVAHQVVRIKTSKQTIERSVYWDLQGTRHLRHVKLPDSGEQLKSALNDAGVDWDRPISASSYQSWHDHQHALSDQVTHSGDHLLTLTTTVPDGDVSEESLTVRDTDFHPVGRTVGFRDKGTVEIAEVDFKILPWSAVDASVFDPIGNVSHTVMAQTQDLPRIYLPETPSPEQLDETELAARLILNKLHADVGEQIDIRRIPQEVEVEGLVETDERAHELKSQLMTVPRLKVSIQSVTDASENSVPGNESVRVTVASLPDQPSALETCLRARGLGTADINVLSQQFFDGALKISQESRAIADLKARFASAKMSIVASATLTELIYSHHERLQTSLDQERRLLAEVVSTSVTGQASAEMSGLPLTEAAARNLELSKELTETNAPSQRNAEEIIADMSVSVDNLESAAHEIYRKPQQDISLSGKR